MSKTYRNREYGDIEEYRKLLVGQKIQSVEFSDSDEGLIITFENGTELDFGFSRCEGSFTVTGKNDVMT
jgi:hypothetical protein